MDSGNSTPVTQGVHHVGLTVCSLEASQRFFTETLRFEQVGELPDYPAVFLSDGSTMITLWQVGDPDNAVPFDRKSVIGLHHLALGVAGHKELDELHARLKETPGVFVEFSPEPLLGGPTRHLMCEIPGRIRVEFIAS